MIKIHNVIQGSAEWHKIRENRYTGQNAHKLLKTDDKSYALNSSHDEWNGNFYTQRGHILEEQAIEIYEKIKGLKVDRPGFVTNDKYPKAGYSPDGLLPDRTIEVKSFNEKRHLSNAEYLEMEVKAQSQFGQVICEKDLTDVILYNPKLDADKALFIITIRKNPLIHKNIKSKIL